MSNPNAAVAAREAKPVEKTPSYAWPCLITSVLAGIALVFAWQWLPGITFPVFKNWLAENNALFANPANFELMSNVMGLVPIGALIMALPASYLVRKIGPKAATVAGLALGAVGTAVSAVFVGDNFYAFLVGRFILGVALATTIVAGPTCVSVWFPDATRGRAMAIWSIWAPVGIFVINFIGNNVFEMAGSDMVAFQWIWVAVIVVFAVIFAIVFREPRENERSQVSPERKSFKEVLPFFKSRQLWCLILMFAIYNYINYGFSQYLKTWMQTPELLGGLGWDAAAAGLWGGLICACGALAPIGGLILDKTPRDKKYLCVVVGILFLLFAFLCGDRFEPVFAYRLSLPLMALGMAIVSLFFYDHWALSVLLIGIGCELFDIVTWILFVDLAQRREDAGGRYRVFGQGVAATLCGMGLGYLVGGELHARLLAESVQMSTVGILCVTVLVVTAFLVIPEGTIAQVVGRRGRLRGGERDGEEGEGPAAGAADVGAPAVPPLEKRCEALAIERHLTPREGEVLVLLARGRTLAIVMRDLQIAKGTAQTHIENVYAKLGVHKQQELIDLVEGCELKDEA